ncbi:uncharacterized protein LOC131207798 [Anopheles bellator]|uniref:uncharacterized protein LOC131207798 n=1 Tax=Anopheles bellator TaxID=139047 RepID=UPI002649940C|nr:uncharacterized protein LOC131207798 [Anopheles bellator]
MEQNIFDVSDDISFPWLPAYAEATEANGGGTTNGTTTSSRMLETIVEETSDDDDGRGDKDHRRRGSAEEEAQPQQPLSWSQYEHVWSSGGSDAESVIRVETPSDQDTMSERDFICPPKRRKQETFGDEFLSSELSIYGRRPPPRICEPDGLLEPNEYFMKRHNEQRLRFDEIGHDLFTDSDSLSYASLSRSSSLIQFESLERQLQSETAAHQHPLSGSSPSLYSTNEPAAAGSITGAADAAGVTPGTRGPKATGTLNRLTTSNLIQKSIGQTALNISDSELYSTSSSVSSSSSSGSSSTGSSGYRYGGASDECAGLRQTAESDRSPDGDTEEELLSATVRCCSSQRCSQRWPRSGSTSRNKNSIESLSEDSGYCDHLGLVANGGVLRVRSKSLTNFGSAENLSFLCGGQTLPPATLLPATMAMQQQQPLSMDYIGGAGTEPGRNPARLSTVCDVEDEEDEYDVSCISATRATETIEWPSAQDVRPAVRWTNINNGTKIEHDPCKQRSEQGPFVAITTRLTPPTPPSSQGGSSSSEESLSPPPPVTTAALMASRSAEVKNSPARGRVRPSFSAPDLLGGGRRSPSSSPFASGPRSGRYDPISFTVSSVPECLNLYGSKSKRGDRTRIDSSDESGGERSYYDTYGGGAGASVASKNFDLYDLQPQAPGKCSKTVTFCVGGAQSGVRPRQNIRASYANLLALNYSDEDDEDYRARGPRHEYYLARNTFRTSSGTKLGRGAAATPPTPRPLRPFGGGPTETAMEREDDEDEESRIFPVDREETNVFNSLLEEISAHFDRNLSIINDQAEAYEPIAAFLLEQRKPQTVATPATTTPPQPPPRRTQIKTNPHVPAVQSPPIAPRITTRRTFDQDPTNLVTCYAASLERCRFDPTETSTGNLYDSRSSGLNGPAAASRSLVPVKREFVASTPNLNYCYGVTTEQGDHHNSLKNVASCRSTASILASSSSRCGLSKGVSFCPIVSEIIWSTGSVSGGESDDNASIISSLELEDAVCHSSSDVVTAGTIERNASPLPHDDLTAGASEHERERDNATSDPISNRSTARLGELGYSLVENKMISAESGSVNVPVPSDAGGGGATMTSTMSNDGIEDRQLRPPMAASDPSNRNGGGMASQSLIASEATVPREPYQQQQPGVNNNNHQNNNNSSLIRNFKNGKAEKKGKTFLSRLSSGFRFSFRNKSKKSALKETTFGVTPVVAPANGSSGSTAQNYNNNHITKKNNGATGGGGGRWNDSATADFIYIPLKDPSRQQRADESAVRQMNTLGVTVDDSFTGAEDEPDDCEIAVTRPPGSGYYRSDSSTALNGSDRNHVLSSKPPLPKLPPRVVGVSTKRQQQPRNGTCAPRDHDDTNEDSRSSSCYYRNPPTTTQLHQYAANALANGGVDSVDGTALARRAHYDDSSEGGGEGGAYYYYDDGGRFNATMGSEQKIGLIETNLDTHETIISGKTRSLMELGGPHHHYRQQHHGHHGHPAHHHPQQPQQHHQDVGPATEPSRPHKSMEFLLDKENQRNVLPPENELQKSHETGTNLSEHQLRVQASLQRLNIPDWYKQYSGKDGVANTTAPPSTTVTSTGAAAGGLLRKRNSDVGRWTGLSSKTTSLSSLGSHRSDRSPVMLSPSAHSHHGQTGFSRWSTSHLNSNQTSPSVSTRGSFTRGGLNASVISGYSNTSTTGTGAGPAGSTAIRNSFRQPYLGWRSQEKLSQPRTPAERLASSLLQQQQQQSSSKQKEQQQQQGRKQQQQHKDESVVTPEIQSSIIEVTSAIVHYVNDQTNRHSRSRSTSPSQRCWLESSFVGTRPLDSPQTPMIENSSVLGSTHQQQQQQSQQTGGDHYRFNAGRMNGVGGTSAAVPTFSLPTEHQSPGSATLEDVLASLLGLPADPNRSSVVNSSGGNHTLQIEPLQTRRRSEGDAATRKRNDSGGSMAISGITATGTTTTNTTTMTSGGSGSNQSGQQQQQASRDLLSADVASRIARRVSLDSAEAAGHQHGHGRGHDYLKCRYPKCDASATLAEARKTYKSCHNCSHLYCSRECRRAHWERHRKACLHSRVSALCRLVLSACKDDADTLRHLSALARRGYLSQGRGVVRILFRSPERADSFLKQGFQCLGEVSYVRWPDLLPAEMGPELYSELLKLSTEYKPDSKMLLYVAICVVSEAPGSATAPVKWERQLVSRCAKLKLCRSVVAADGAGGPGKLPQAPAAAPPRKDTVGDVLVLSFQILAKTTPRAREQVSTNIQSILRQRGVQLRKHYPEVYQRLATFVEGTTDRFLPVTLHPRDSVTGRSFVCIIMPNYGEVADRVQFPVSENSDDRVVTIDVGADLGDDLTSKL